MLPKKKGLAVVIGLGKPKDDEDAPESKDEDMGDVDEAYHDAAEELVAAVKDGDPDRVVDAFKLMHRLCAEHSEPDGDEGY